MQNKRKIRWEYNGKPDPINGTGAYKEEKILAYTSAIILPLILIYQILNNLLDWSPAQIIIAIYVGFDLGGGIS